MIKFKKGSHDAAYDAVIATEKFYNDDIAIVANISETEQPTVATFTVDDGYITGVVIRDAAYITPISTMFKDIIA